MQLTSKHSTHLFETVRDYLAGNHVAKDEIALEAQRHESYLAHCVVAWKLGPKVQVNTSTGYSSIEGRHFGFSKSALQMHLATLSMEAAADQGLRDKFTQGLDAAREQGLALATSDQVVHDYGQFSRHEQCTDCHGRGKTTCIPCGGAGRTRCVTCGGLGTTFGLESYQTFTNGSYQTHTRPATQRCSMCLGGYRTCSGCHGSGKVGCAPCASTGGFTWTYGLRLQAEPQWYVPAPEGLYGTELAATLQGRGPTGAADIVKLEFGRTKWHEGRYCVEYVGEVAVSEVQLRVQSHRYTVAGAGPRPTLLRTAPIFDQLMHAELARAQQGEQGLLMGAREAKKLFARFQQLPMMDRALRTYAQTPSAQKQPAQVATAAAQGLISEPAAHSLGKLLHQVLLKVSPPYSTFAWVVGAGFPMLSVFGLSATQAASRGTLTWGDCLWLCLYAACFAVLGVLLLSPLTALASKMHVRYLCAKLPAGYRLPERNWKPLGTACQAALWTGVCAILYGRLEHYLPLPSVSKLGYPLLHLFAHFFSH